MERTVRETDAAGALWDFAVRLYAEPGVGEACLVLQDRFGVDVPLLLWAAWLGDGADAAALRAGDRAVGPWRARAVRPLRALRAISAIPLSGWMGCAGSLAQFRKAAGDRRGTDGARYSGRNRPAERTREPGSLCRRVRPGTQLPRAEADRGGSAPACISARGPLPVRLPRRAGVFPEKRRRPRGLRRWPSSRRRRRGRRFPAHRGRCGRKGRARA